MSGTQVWGLVSVLIGFFLTLTIIGALLGVPLMIVGAVLLASGNRPAQIQQVIVQQPGPAPVPPRIGEVRNGHIYRLASDGRCYWYPMTPAEQQQHRIRMLEEQLGLGGHTGLGGEGALRQPGAP